MQNEKEKMIPVPYSKLFKATFLISIMTFGGGYVMVSLMKNKFVDKYKWIEDEEMLDIVAIASSCPGPLAINSSILVGYKMRKIPGALVTLVGAALPPLLVGIVVALIYENVKDNAIVRLVLNGMRIGIAAVIADVVIGMIMGIVKNKSVMGVIILVAAFIAVMFFNVNVIVVMIFAGIIGAISIFGEEDRI